MSERDWRATGTACVSTPVGAGAVATVLFRGNGSLLDRSHGRGFSARNGRGMEQQLLNRIVSGLWGDEPGEQVVVCRVAEDEFEIHCHGGRMATARILEDLETAGCRIVAWETYLAERDGTWEAEWRGALSRTVSESALRSLLEQPMAWKRLREDFLRVLPDREKMRKILADVHERSRFGKHLTEPYKIVLAGRPNVGKSSLLNAILGYERAIVHGVAGTTRDVVEGTTAIGGCPVRLWDTAGIRTTADEIEGEGIARTLRSVEEADGTVLVLDGSEPMTDEDAELLSRFSEGLAVINKVDLPARWDLGGVLRQREGMAVSARTGAGLEELMQGISKKFFEPAIPGGSAVPFSERLRSVLSELVSDQNILEDAEWLRSCERLWEGCG